MTDTSVGMSENELSRIVLEGRYDALLEPKVAGKAATLRPERVAMIQQLTGWVDEKRLDNWKEQRDEFLCAPEARAYWRRSGLIVEAYIEHPLLESVISTDTIARLPTDSATNDFLKEIQRRLGIIVAGNSLTESQRVLFADLYSLAKLVAAYCVVATIFPYRLFRTPKAELFTIHGKLLALAECIAEVRKLTKRFHMLEANSTSRNNRTNKRITSLIERQAMQEMLSITGLTSLQLGRIGRAAGGDMARAAARHLARALEFFEIRAVAKCRTQDSENTTAIEYGISRLYIDPRDGRNYLVASNYRASKAVLQQAYWNLLHGFHRKSISQLRTARLLALSTHNTLLELEIKLVALSVKQARLRPLDLRNGAPAALHKRRRIVRGLRALIVANDSFGNVRTTYSLMAIYQLALCYMHDEDNTKAFEYAERLLADAEQARHRSIHRAVGFGPAVETVGDTYWIASAHILMLILNVRQARRIDEARRYNDALPPRETAEGAAARTAENESEVRLEMNRSRLLQKGMQHGELALAAIHESNEFNNLAAKCHVDMAEAYVLAGNFPKAEMHLRQASQEPTSGGYTTHSFVDAMAMLVRSEMEIGRRRPQRALAELRRFRRIMQAHGEITWVKERYQELKHRAESSTNLLLITDSDLRHAPQLYTYHPLRKHLQQYLLEANRRIHGNLSDNRMAERLDVNVKTLRTFMNETKDPIADEVRKNTAARATKAVKEGVERATRAKKMSASRTKRKLDDPS